MADQVFHRIDETLAKIVEQLERIADILETRDK